jgi:hypothetical protein
MKGYINASLKITNLKYIASQVKIDQYIWPPAVLPNVIRISASNSTVTFVTMTRILVTNSRSQNDFFNVKIK